MRDLSSLGTGLRPTRHETSYENRMMNVLQSWVSEVTELPSVPFSHFQTIEYAALLPSYGQQPCWSVVRDQLGRVVATWLFFITPANYLDPPRSRLRRALDQHLQAFHGPVIAPELTTGDRHEVINVLLQAVTDKARRAVPLSVRIILDPVMTDSERTSWIQVATSSGLHREPSYSYVAHLPETHDELSSMIRSERRTKIRKAIQAEARFEEVEDTAGLEAYYEVRMSTTKHNRVAPIPWWYFEATFEHLFPLGMYRVFLARFGTRVGAGQAAFLWNGYVYLAGVSVAEWARDERVPANEFLQWEVLSWAQRHGFRLVDFVGANPGSHDPKLRGIDAFKASWGTTLTESLILEVRTRPILRGLRRVANRASRSLLS